MFKNAGTTLDWSLRRCFGEQFIDHRDDDAMRGSGGYLASCLAAHPQVRALSSHWLPMPLPTLAGFSTQVVMLLRDPMERSRSVYNFERTQQGANSPGKKKARELTFQDYVKWRLQPGSGPVIKNFHTRFCSGNYFGKDMAQLYDQALANLESIPLIGLVHRYSESMVFFEHGLSAMFPKLDLSWQVQNASQTGLTSPEDRVEGIAADLDDTYALLIAANKYDIMLLQHVEKRLNNQLSQIPNMDERLCSIHQRNESLK